MSIMLDEAQTYENSRDYDCCQIVEGAYTVGDAIYEDAKRHPLTPKSRRPQSI